MQTEQLIKALETCNAEMTTLVARLGQPYRRNIEACIGIIRSALEGSRAENPMHEVLRAIVGESDYDDTDGATELGSRLCEIERLARRALNGE